MKRVIVASKNPVKLAAVQEAVTKMLGPDWQVMPGAGQSGVSDQPMSSAETLLGAKNRAVDARKQQPDGDLWIGIEGGIEEDETGMSAFAWVVADSGELRGTGRSATFYLPEPIATLVRQGVELGEADDQVFGRVNSKQDDGAIGILSGGALNRAGLYEHAVIASLLAMTNRDLYGPKSAAPNN